LLVRQKHQISCIVCRSWGEKWSKSIHLKQ
jgi:hypothetical protein